MHSVRSNENEVRELAKALYRESHGFLLAVAIKNAPNRRDAEDALQEAFISFMRSFDPTGEAPALAWITLTLKRECWRKRRDAHLDRYVGQEVARGDDERGTVIEALPDRGTSIADRVVDLDEARRRLAPLKRDERTALGALAAGYSYRDIATLKDWTYTKTHRCIREGRAALAAAA